MGSQVSIRCSCCGGRTDGNEDMQEEDKLNMAQNMSNEEEPIMNMPMVNHMPLLRRSVSTTTIAPSH